LIRIEWRADSKEKEKARINRCREGEKIQKEGDEEANDDEIEEPNFKPGVASAFILLQPRCPWLRSVRPETTE
jgi:hypothetical protein